MEEIEKIEFRDLAFTAKLRYVNDTEPGIRRVRLKHGFSYRDKGGVIIKDKKELQRFKSLAIPPAWDTVWICKDTNGHIQATGIDEKGRKQYRYSSKWIEISQQTKFHHLRAFGERLPLIREKINADMRAHSLQEKRVLATVIWLLEHTYIRIGNDTYARENKHYGLTTLRTKHVNVENSTVTFDFIGKSGKAHSVDVKDARIAKTIRQLEDLPGYELFQYIDTNGVLHKVNSQDVNSYLQEIAGDTISAKDFRTWGGTVLSATVLHTLGNGETQKDIQKNITTAIKEVAIHLRNTPAVCRKYYIHPIIPESYGNNTLVSYIESMLEKNSKTNTPLLPYEMAVMGLLALHT